MKIRNGFVSNSSSSSFLIFGISLGMESCKKILSEKFGMKTKDMDMCELTDSIEELSIEYFEGEKSTHLNIYSIPDSDTIYLGRSYGTIEDMETGREFKQKVISEINSALKTDFTETEFKTYKKAWYNG